MSLNGDQIEELRARVPLAYRPWDRPSAPVKAPANEVSEVDNAARSLNEKLLNLSRGEGDLAERIGYRAPGGNQKPGSTATEEKKRRETDAKFALDQARKALEERLRQLDAELAAIDADLKRIRAERADIKTGLEALDELRELRASGKLDLNNPAHQKLLKRAGISVEEMRRGDQDAILAARQAALLGRDQELEVQENERLKSRERVLLEREDVVGALDEIENADDPASAARAVARAETTLGVQQIAEATYQSDSTEAKVFAADTVAQAEDADVQAESGAYTREGVAQVAAVTDIGTADFDFDAPPAQGSVAEGVAPTPIAAPPLTPQFAMAADPASAAPKANDPLQAIQPAAPLARSMTG